MSSFNVQLVQIVVLALVALAVVLQVILVIAIFVSLGKVTKAIKEEIADMRASIMPIVFDTRELMTKVTPKIEATVEDLAAVAHGLRTQSQDLESTSTEILERLRHQSVRLDSILSGLLDALDRAGVAVTDAVGRPIRQISGILASVKAVVESLRSVGSAPRPERSGRDGDMFV
jgi:methyl-accepting chemotaxis protein